jgi:PII-like signaling protein
MPKAESARLLRIHICASDRWEGKPLYEALVARCREMKIAGATVFQGLEGFGESAELHRSHLGHRDQPILITVFDTAENIARLLPVIEPMIDTGLIAISDVELIRVQKRAASPPAASV